MSGLRRFETSLKRLKCANSGHRPIPWRAAPADPERKFPGFQRQTPSTQKAEAPTILMGDNRRPQQSMRPVA
jgi:hypothetical protein